jgi:hypothetical protein
VAVAAVSTRGIPLARVPDLIDSVPRFCFCSPGSAGSLGFMVISRAKGVKCLDVSTGRIYVSRDVVFDEAVFPFKDLHPNAGALLRKEIILLDKTLYNVEQGDEIVDDSTLTNPTNSVSQCLQQFAGENPVQNDQGLMQNETSHNSAEEDEISAEFQENSLSETVSGSSPG